MDHTPGQKAAAEFIGTFSLTFIAIIAIVTNMEFGSGDGNGLVAIGIANGLVIATMVAATFHISGGHLNPAVTVVAVVTRRITAGLGAIYIGAQFAGATVAALLLRAALPGSWWASAAGGSVGLDVEVSMGRGILIEAILTFFLVYVIFGTAIDEKSAFRNIAALAIGFVVMMDIMAAGPLTGAAMNPARAFGPALAGGYWDNHVVYWVGPIVGGLVAGLTYQAVNLRPAKA